MNREFLIYGFLLNLLYCASGQPIVLQSQEWDYLHGQVFNISDYRADYQKSELQPSTAEPVAMAHDWDFAGEHEALSASKGLSFLEYESLFSDSFTSTLLTNGGSEAMLAVNLGSTWDFAQITNVDDGQMAFDQSVQGRIQFTVTEQSRFVLRVAINASTISVGDRAEVISRAEVRIYNESELSAVDVYLPIDVGAESTTTREFTLAPGDYTADISLGLYADVQSGGLSIMEGESSTALTLFARNLEVGELPITLGIQRGEPDFLLFSATNLEIGKTYGLQASPDLSFDEPDIVARFDRKVLHPLEEVYIGSMGAQHFFRLVELED